MGDTNRHKAKRLLKTAIIKREKDLGAGPIGQLPYPSVASGDCALREMCRDFWRGSLRYGNASRKFRAKAKVYARKLARRGESKNRNRSTRYTSSAEHLESFDPFTLTVPDGTSHYL